MEKETAPVPPQVPTPTQPQPQSQPIPGPKNKVQPLTIVLIVLAALGLGFGGFELYQSLRKSSEIRGLEVDLALRNDSIADLRESLTDILATGTMNADEVMATLSSTNPGSSDSSNKTNSNVASKDYIYIGDWGIKLKIPSSLNLSGYTLVQNQSPAYICATGAAIGTGHQYVPEFAFIDKASLGCMERVYKQGANEYATAHSVYEDSDYYYVYTSPQAMYSMDQAEQDWELQTVQLIKEMFTQNISTF